MGKSWPFWSNKNIRPKRNYQGILLFGDLLFGGLDEAPFPPFLIKSFSRPGYSALETVKGEYQLKTGDFAQVFYPTQGYTTNDLNIELVDATVPNPTGGGGPDVTAHIYNILTIMGKTWTYEQQANISSEAQRLPAVINNITAYMRGYPPFITLLELDDAGKVTGTWRVHNPLLKTVDFSDIDYGREDLNSVKLSFVYKNFEFTHKWGSQDLAAKWNAASRAYAYSYAATNTGITCDGVPQTGQDIDHSRKAARNLAFDNIFS